MSLLDILRAIFGRPKPPQPPQPTPARPVVIRTGVAGAAVRMSDDMEPVIADGNGDAPFPVVPGDWTAFNLHLRHDDFEAYDMVVDLPPGAHHYHIGPIMPITQPGFEIELPPWARTVRRGVVRRDVKAVQDDNGHFHPLGCTMFWGLHGWKFERARYQQNIDFLSHYNYDYVRMACHTSWPDKRIDPNWPDYAQVLGETIDYHYARGLRTALFVIGDPIDASGEFHFDPMDLCATIATVINAGRSHKVIYIEMSNEYGVGPKVDIAKMKSMATYFQVALAHPRPMLALSSPGDDAALRSAADASFLELYTVHTDRDAGDRGSKWRQVRQGWNFRDYPQVVDSNEPPGPQSSVDTNDSPLQLALMRATGVISGGALYVFHVGAMVKGDTSGYNGRPPNLWEVPNIQQLLNVIRDVATVLPVGVENWTHCTFHGEADGRTVRVGPPIPLLPHRVWSDGYNEGVDRSFAAVNGSDFVQVVLGVLNFVQLTPYRDVHVDAIDPVTLRVVASADLPADTPWTLPGAPDTQAGYILIGRYR